MYKIVTDSAANIAPEEAASLGVTVLPLSIIFGNREYRDGENLTPAAFYEMLEIDS